MAQRLPCSAGGPVNLGVDHGVDCDRQQILGWEAFPGFRRSFDGVADDAHDRG